MHLQRKFLQPIACDSRSCDAIILTENIGGRAPIPVNNLDVILFSNAIGFACISGGKCINRTDDPLLNELSISESDAPELKASTVNALKLNKKSCGGTVKRRYWA
jgi:hypothetical protein